MKQNKDKIFEVNGVLEYADCFKVNVKAKSPKEAKKKVKENLSKLSDPASAEFQGGIVDLGIETNDEEEHYLFS